MIKENKHENELIFYETEPRKIGEESDEWKNKTVDEIDDKPKVVFTFSNPESVNSLIIQLLKIQQSILMDKT